MRAKLPSTLIPGIPRTYSHSPQRIRSFLLCYQCSAQLSLFPQPLQTPRPQNTTRTLHTTLPLQKKGGKQDSKRTVPLNAEKSEGLDPFDFTGYEAAILRAHENLESELAKIKAGGRNPESIENVKVKLNKEKGSKETVKLGDLASVVPRGRNVGVLVGEKDVSWCFCY